VTEPASTTFQVGQKVLVTHPERRPIETEVTKVGRSLVHVPNMAFHMDTGTERRGLNAAGYAHRLLTPEQYAEEQERIRLRADLGQAGLNFADCNGPTRGFSDPGDDRGGPRVRHPPYRSPRRRDRVQA
jgi:hypothetical protein